MATLEQIQTKMKQLQMQADALISKKIQAAVGQIRALMLKHGLTTEDIEAKGKAKRQAKASNGSAGHVKAKASDGVKGKATPKYQHPKTGATWSGRGRAPAWIAEAKNRDRFLITGAAEAAVATTVSVVSKAKTAGKKTASKSVGATAGKGQRKGPQPAKYRDPKSGATWSGRGPAPAWLSGANDREKFLIAGVSGVADSSAAGKPKAVAKKPATKTAVEKKATTAKKAAAKATVSGKVAATKSATARKVVANGATPALKKAAKKAPPRKSIVAKKVVTKPGAAAAPEAAPAQATV